MASGRTADEALSRAPLDQLVQRLRDAEFVRSHRRAFGLRQTGTHVNPLMLAAAGRDSSYVAAWRRHAARCEACARLFEYFGFDTADA
jgi:hypothetical protein